MGQAERPRRAGANKSIRRGGRFNDSPVRRSFNKGGTIHVATACVMVRDIARILTPDHVPFVYKKEFGTLQTLIDGGQK